MDIGVTVRAIFNRRSIKLAKGDKAPVLIEVYFKGRKKKYINTTISIEQDQWGTSGVDYSFGRPIWISIFKEKPLEMQVIAL